MGPIFYSGDTLMLTVNFKIQILEATFFFKLIQLINEIVSNYKI